MFSARVLLPAFWFLAVAVLLSFSVCAAEDGQPAAPDEAINRLFAPIKLLDPDEEEARGFQDWLAGGLHPRQMIPLANIPEKQAPAPRISIEQANEVLDQILFGPETTGSEDAQSRLDSILNRKIELIHRLCSLDDVQRRKLRLAGRGDIHRFFQRAVSLREKLPDVVAYGVTIEFARETRDLHKLVRHGAFDNGSLFSKTLHKLLSPGQISEYARNRRDLTPAVRALLPELRAEK